MSAAINNSLAIFLLAEDKVRMIEVGYKVDSDGKPVPPFYHFKTFDLTIVVGDFVVVPASSDGERAGMYSVAKVNKVDIEPDFASSITYKWIADRFDASHYAENVAREREMIDLINQAERTRQKAELRAKLTEHMDQDGKAHLSMLASPAAAVL